MNKREVVASIKLLPYCRWGGSFFTFNELV